MSAKNSGNLGVTFPPGSLPGVAAGISIPVRASADASLSVRQGVIDLAAAYRVVDTTLGDSAATRRFPRLFVDPIVGLRILSQKLEVDNVRLNNIPVGNLPIPVPPPVNQNFRTNRTTVEPLIGARIGLDLSERWSVGIRGDVSGFNLYADRNLTWNLLIGTQYQLSPNTSLQLSYRFNNFDFEDGSGLSRTKLNLRQNGLLLGAIFRF
ncbi:outer membrane protein [Myxacorys almedinensis]|uniref:outer membrane protein n=1 Tax=Myxacorys almedinensis TaxID=2651157 RepID=UPI00192E9F2E|nr:outer membrane beta-barrel protein [Myxacorys almedinensis]